MATIIEKTGKTIEDALKAALEELGADESAVEYEVLEEPRKGILGLIGTRPAKLRVTVKEPPKVEHPSEPKIEPPVETLIEPTIDTSVAPAETPSEEPLATIEPSKAQSDGQTVEPTVDRSDNQTVDPTVEQSDDKQSADEPFVDPEVVERAKSFLMEVFDTMHLKVQIDGRLSEHGYLLNIWGDKLGILIGKHGQTLDALQYLVNIAANRQYERRMHFVLDIEGYRAKRTASLQSLAKVIADRVIKTRREVRLEPMTRYERKVIHLALQGYDKILTQSTGSEPYRYVTILPRKSGEK